MNRPEGLIYENLRDLARKANHLTGNYLLKNRRNIVYVIVITIPRTDMAMPATALLLCSTFKLENPRIIPSTLATPPQTGMMATQRLISPRAGDAMAKNFAVRNSGSRLLGSVSM
jgi:hypothetical protein